MTSASPALDQAFADLRRSAEAAPAECWLPAALHTLIMAALARVFARLEQVFLLWQSGQLPVPPPRAKTPPIGMRAPSTPRTRTDAAVRQARTYSRARTTTRAMIRLATRSAQVPRPMPIFPRGILAPPPPPHSRAPPQPRHPICRVDRLARIADPRAISLLYQINIASRRDHDPASSLFA